MSTWNDPFYLKLEVSEMCMNEDKFVRKFCEEPFQISALSHSENHFYDFLGILHILLVKNYKKKFHITGGNKKNVLRVSQTLKIYCNRLNRPFVLDKYQSDIIDKQTLDLLINKKSRNSPDLCFAIDEKSITELNGVPLTDGGLGTLFEYPECCVQWFIQSTWKDKEIAYNYVKEHRLAATNEELLAGIENFAHHKWMEVPELVQKIKLEVHYLGYYLSWHPQGSYYYAVENGEFEPSPERTPGTYSKYNSIDDKIDDFHYYTTGIKFGRGRATEDAAQEIRSGEITREEGVALVERFDLEWPDRFADDVFEYLSIHEKEFPIANKQFEQSIMDREYFFKLADSFRSPHIWKWDGKTWRLRNTVWGKK